MNKSVLVLLTTILIIFSSSCHIVKPFFIKNKKQENRIVKRIEKKVEKGKLDSSYISKPITTTPKVVTTLFDTVIARKIIKHSLINYKTFQSKTKMHYENGDQKQNFTASFRLEKDKKIWASISGFGLEVARAIITPDSVKAIDKFNKRYYLYSYRDIQKLINMEVEFKNLQDLIIGNAVGLDGKISDVKEINSLMSIFISNADFSNQLTFNKTDSTLKQIQLQATRSISKSAVLISLNNYQLLENKFISTDRTYYIQDIKGASQLNMEVNKIEIDKDIDFPFSIPSNYKRVIK